MNRSHIGLEINSIEVGGGSMPLGPDCIGMLQQNCGQRAMK